MIKYILKCICEREFESWFSNSKNFVEKNFEFVGKNFSRELKEIYYGNKKNKNIYGTVSSKEREELEEEGIELSSIPWPKDKEN